MVLYMAQVERYVAKCIARRHCTETRSCIQADHIPSRYRFVLFGVGVVQIRRRRSRLPVFKPPCA